MKKILYNAMHEILEYDDLRILSNAGFDVYSTGSFAVPHHRSNRFRSLGGETFGNLMDIASRHKQSMWRDEQNVQKFSQGFIEEFDIVIVNHDPNIITSNIEALATRPVIFRTVGQTNLAIETHLRGLADKIIVVRYDARETHPQYLKHEAVIHFGKYLDEFPCHKGGGDFLLTFMNGIWRPQARPLYDDYREITRGFPLRIYGMQNNEVENAFGIAAPDEQLSLFERCTAYIYTHSTVASYTLDFVEALAVGAPIVAPSAAFAASPLIPDWWLERYAVEDILSDGAGFTYDSIRQAREILGSLRERDLPQVTHNARARAMELFDARKIEKQWKTLIDKFT